MLLKRTELNAIKAGKRSLFFRRWRRPRVKTGGTLKTAVGVLAVDRVTPVKRRDITAKDAAAAGYDSLASLLAALAGREGDIYRIELRYAGADPRIRLRERDKLTAAEFDELRAKLGRLDAASRIGPWTRKLLAAIQKHPKHAAARLAAKTGYEKDWLKVSVRKLKNLGLTISHQSGYELSPRGKAALRRLKREG